MRSDVASWRMFWNIWRYFGYNNHKDREAKDAEVGQAVLGFAHSPTASLHIHLLNQLGAIVHLQSCLHGEAFMKVQMT